MEPTGFKSRGSFGIPEGLKKELEDARKNPPPQAPTHPKAPPAPAAVEVKQAAPSPAVGEAPAPQDLANREPTKEEQADDLRQLRAKIEDSLGAAIDDKDIQDYVFRGRLTKTVTILPGILEGTFQTLTPTEIQAIDEGVADFQARGKFTSEGVVNERAILTLSYSWVAAAGKPLATGNDNKKREEKIRKMGAITVDSATRAFNELNLLLRVVFGEKQFQKKS
jgi:hypothetical protein